MKKKHRHKWEIELNDCAYCCRSEYEMCHKDDCGAMRDPLTKIILAE